MNEPSEQVPEKATPSRNHYQPSGLNDQFRADALTFAQYIAHTQVMLTRARIDLTPETKQKIILANSPFAWNPPLTEKSQPTRGVLLIHGLLDSPFSMRDIARHFLARGFVVRSVLLPGHGSVPGDLLTTPLSAWINVVAYGVACLQAEVQEVFLCGLSGGAGLAIHYAYTQNNIAGLLLFSPLIQLKTPWGRLAQPLTALITAVGKFHETIAWCKKSQEIDYCKYESFPFYFVAQAYQLTQEIQQLATHQRLACPLFMALTADDETIDVHSASAFFHQQSHPANQLLIYTTQPPLTPLPNTEYRNSQLLDQGIVNFSHTCLHIAPDNPHYGQGGDYPGIIHAMFTHPWRQKTSGLYLGALTKKNLLQYRLRRLTFNPDYSTLMNKVDRFLAVLKGEPNN